ncbi:hypothetical protein [Enterococcus durans]|uniref:hypothetical protein n=1 Tax=Enterococcus durans TaxID=53345 RepID=UPI002330A129|nr:hypothetical protein [Enterococcus durans]WCG26404.1 hypothetical protein PML98_07325 [Enterococcus durans]WCG67968.1 hypothetical protein PML92_07335 [Enterococcus durans]
MPKKQNTLIKIVNNFLHWYLGKEYTPKDILELILTIVAITFVIFGFFKNKIYYEDVSIEYYPINTQQNLYPRNISDEIEIDKEPTNVVLVSPADVPIKVEIMRYKSMQENSKLVYQDTGISKEIEPGDALKISYIESEGIPNYQLHIITKYGEADIPLIFNGRFEDINKTKIKSTRKIIPYFIDKMLN